VTYLSTTLNKNSINIHFTGKGSFFLWMSAFLVERNYVLWRGIAVSAGIAGTQQPRHIQKMNRLFNPK
jgi:hypothetical protein